MKQESESTRHLEEGKRSARPAARAALHDGYGVCRIGHAKAVDLSRKKVTLRVDALRPRRRLEELSVYGRPEGGRFADGVSRVAYSDADVGGRKHAMQAMAETGLKPRIDPAGNIFGLWSRMHFAPHSV